MMLKFMRAYPLIFVVILGLLLFFFGTNIAAFYTDYLWFGEVGQRAVFARIYGTRILLFGVFGIASFLLAYLNLRLADRFSPSADVRGENGVLWDKGNGKPADKAVRVLSGFRRVLSALLLGGALVFAVIAGLTAQGEWDTFLRFSHPVAFGILDTQYGRDLSLYIFVLPFVRFVQNWLLVVLLVIGVGVAILYLYQQGINSVAGRAFVAPHVRAHLSALAALALFVKAWDYYLDRYDLLYGGSGSLLPGAGYTDIHARLPMLMLMVGVTCLAGLTALVNVWRRTLILPGVAVGLWLAFSAAGVVIPGSIQRLRVRPNEAQREAPYIARAIEATRHAYDIDAVKIQNFPASETLTQKDLAANQATLANIRLWDYEPLLETYPQQQGFRQYYNFPDVDVDRYTTGKNGTGYQQVLLAAREIAPDQLDARAQTWPNLHLRYTHGFGVVMNPAGKVTTEGLPEYLLRDIPPVASDPALALTQPRIYFGTGAAAQSYVVVNTHQAEFDYPGEAAASGGGQTAGGPVDVETRYTGQGGIPLSPLAKFAFAVRFAGWTNLMLSTDVTAQSRFLFARRVPDRIKRVAPFLLLDRDPYPVVAKGHVVWIQDAYTTSGAYPYAAPVETSDNLSREQTINYIRNSVKATVDAYDGTVHLYAADETDPLLRAYQQIFPGLILPLSQMPPEIRAHRRYPEDLFTLQRHLLADYHVTDPNVWYSRADGWQAAQSQNTVENENSGQPGGPMQPYFVILRLPGEKSEEFALVSPFTPRDRENMVSLLAARCDGDHYGERILYRFPASRVVYGPQQVGKRIRSDSKISPYLSLNDQKGSHVLFGSMLVVPIEQSLLYVQPLYVKAAGGDSGVNSIPELKQIVVAFENRIAMEPTLPAALADLFGGANGGDTAPPASDSGATTPQAGASISTAALIEQAGQQYDRAQTALRAGDFAGYGRQSKALGETLKRLRGQNAPLAPTNVKP